jgi:hypothetical protein
MKLTISSVDHAPDDLYDQTPFVARLLRALPGPDRPDYWLAELERPLAWQDQGVLRQVTHLIVAARWAGTQIEPHVESLPVGLAYVIDSSQLSEQHVDLAKCKYVAIGLATETEGGNVPQPITHVLAGHIAAAFGAGKKS